MKNIEIFNETEKQLLKELAISKEKAIKNNSIFKELIKKVPIINQNLNKTYHETTTSISHYERLINEYKYLRVPINADIEYRKRQLNTFAELVKKYSSPDSNLRFHGCPLYNAEQIIKSKTISSNIGHSKKEDNILGSFAVSNISNIDITVKNFADLDGGIRNYCLPAGCIFILNPKNDSDAKLINILRMQDIDFKKNPEQLCGIITTIENVFTIRELLIEEGLEYCPVFDYDYYIEYLKEKKSQRKI